MTFDIIFIKETFSRRISNKFFSGPKVSQISKKAKGDPIRKNSIELQFVKCMLFYTGKKGGRNLFSFT